MSIERDEATVAITLRIGGVTVEAGETASRVDLRGYTPQAHDRAPSCGVGRDVRVCIEGTPLDVADALEQAAHLLRRADIFLPAQVDEPEERG